MLVFPADAPLGGQAALTLLQHLTDRPDVGAVVGSDAEGREQPLQLALRPEAAAALVRAAGPTAGSGASARRLLHTLEPPAVPHRLDAVEVFDIDTSEQQQIWQLRSSAAVQALLAAVATARRRSGPLVVALDGRSGTGKSTLAAALALEADACLVHGDDFYSPDLARLTPRSARPSPTPRSPSRCSIGAGCATEALEPLIRPPAGDLPALRLGAQRRQSGRGPAESSRAGWWCSRGSTRRAPSWPI